MSRPTPPRTPPPTPKWRTWNWGAAFELLFGLLAFGLIAVVVIVGLHAMKVSEGTSMPGLDPATLAEMERLYKLAGDDVNAITGKAILQLDADPDRPPSRSAQYTLTRQAQVAKAIDARLAALNVQAYATLKPNLIASQERSIRLVQKQAEDLRRRNAPEMIGRNAADGTVAASFVGINDDAIRLLAQDTAAKTMAKILDPLNIAAAQQGENARSLLRELGNSAATRSNDGRAATEKAVNTAIARALINGDREIARRDIRIELGKGILGADAPESFRKLGNQLVEVGGATISLRAYAYTVARTRSAEVANRTIVDRMIAMAFDAAIVTGRITDNPCTDNVGLIVGLSDEITFQGRTYPSLESIGGPPPWHCNCSKTLIPFDFAVATAAQLSDAAAALDGIEGGLAEAA